LTSFRSEAFNAAGLGLPTPNLTVAYTAVGTPGNLWALLDVITNSPIQSFGPGDLQGGVTLRYGSFLDPHQVPVEILAMNLTLPSVVIHGSPTGINAIHLPVGPAPTLVYNSTTGFLETPNATGIPLEIDNSLVSGQATTLYLEAQVQPSGLLAFGQGLTFFPAQVPSASTGGYVVLGALLLATAAIALGTRAWARSWSH